VGERRGRVGFRDARGWQLRRDTLQGVPTIGAWQMGQCTQRPVTVNLTGDRTLCNLIGPRRDGEREYCVLNSKERQTRAGAAVVRHAKNGLRKRTERTFLVVVHLFYFYERIRGHNAEFETALW